MSDSPDDPLAMMAALRQSLSEMQSLAERILRRQEAVLASAKAADSGGALMILSHFQTEEAELLALAERHEAKAVAFRATNPDAADTLNCCGLVVRDCLEFLRGKVTEMAEMMAEARRPPD